MKSKAPHTLVFPIIVGLLLAVSMSSAFAQSQALNGQIEGTVLDETNAVVPNAVITVTNIETSATRTVQPTKAAFIAFRFFRLELIASPPKLLILKNSSATTYPWRPDKPQRLI